MSTTTLIIVALSGSAACNLLMLGAGLVAGGGKDWDVRHSGAIFALLAGAAMAVMAVGNIAEQPLLPVMNWLEVALTVGAGPVFLALVRRLLGVPVRPERLAAPAAGVLAVLALASVIFGTPPDVRPAVLVQWVYSLAALGLAAAPEYRRRHDRAARLAQALLLGAVIVHLAQGVRMLAPSVLILKPIVPIAISAMAFAAVFAAARGPTARQTEARRRESSAASVEGLRALMQRDNACFHPDYRLHDLAEAAGLPLATVSQVINDATGEGFVRFVNAERLQRACELLRSPAESRTSMEAIGLLAGFRSRSAFYRTFAEAYGMSPAAYRKRSDFMS